MWLRRVAVPLVFLLSITSAGALQSSRAHATDADSSPQPSFTSQEPGVSHPLELPPIQLVGQPVAGSQLKASTGDWQPGVSFEFLWFINGTEIDGRSDTLTLTDGMFGAEIKVQITGSLVGYQAASVLSQPFLPRLNFTTVPSPKISGTARVDQALYAVPAGDASPRQENYSYEWRRSGSTSVIGRGSTYVPTPADVGKTVTVTAIAEGARFTSKASKASVASAVIQKGLFTAVPTPSISGVFRVSETLTAIPGGNSSPSQDAYIYEWRRSGSTTVIAKSPTYTLTSSDLGKKITVTAIATRTQYMSKSSATSAQSSTVQHGLFTLVPPPVISGTPRVGQSLSVTPSGPAFPVQANYTYSWWRGGTSKAIATGSKYTLTPADTGKVITVTATANRAGFVSRASTSSAATAPVEGIFTTVTKPSIMGTARVGETLTAKSGGSSIPAQDAYDYEWRISGSSTVLGTGDTYTLTAAETGKKVVAFAIARRTGFAPKASSPSTPTSAVQGIFTEVPQPTVVVTQNTFRVGEKLSAVSGGDATPVQTSVVYEWRRSDSSSVISTGETYSLTASDLGKQITVTALVKRVGYQSAASLPSLPTPAVSEGVFSSVPVAEISTRFGPGNRVGMTVKANLKSGANALPTQDSFVYHWRREGSPIVISSGSAYQLTAADIGHTLTVTAVAKKKGYLSRESTPTAMRAPITEALASTTTGLTTYKQRDPRWTNTQVGITTMGWTACVPAAFAMTLSGVGLSQTPVQVAQVMNQYGDYNRGIAGAGAYSIYQAGLYYGVQTAPLSSRAQIESALAKGKSVIALVSGPNSGSGNITAAGTTHAVVLTGLSGGSTFVRNPGRLPDHWHSVVELWNYRSTLPFDSHSGAVFWSVG